MYDALHVAMVKNPCCNHVAGLVFSAFCGYFSNLHVAMEPLQRVLLSTSCGCVRFNIESDLEKKLFPS